MKKRPELFKKKKEKTRKDYYYIILNLLNDNQQVLIDFVEDQINLIDNNKTYWRAKTKDNKKDFLNIIDFVYNFITPEQQSYNEICEEIMGCEESIGKGQITYALTKLCADGRITKVDCGRHKEYFIKEEQQ